MAATAFSSLIPVLVTGIQLPRVRAVNDSNSIKASLAPKDLGALDSCDKHRNDGGEVVAIAANLAESQQFHLSQYRLRHPPHPDTTLPSPATSAK
ncbi:hypothetical protein EFQ99_31395 [Rhizobium vallis]|uniref:Uncharacterized protein n=1 Tax=Rhizobium vallis TaxID=634290 RepID=A0A432PC60_9HYPH|nr:hypothetical protein EFQ99_31395 [Rhizobium vallis]